MAVIRKLFSIAMAFSLVLLLTPVNQLSAFGDEPAVDVGEAKDITQGFVGVSGEKASADSNFTASQALSSSSSALQSTDSFFDSNIAEIEYVLIERSEVPVGEEQNIVVSFKDNSLEFDSAELVVTNLSGSRNYIFDATSSIPGALLFKVEGGALDEGFYKLASLEVVSNGQPSNISFQADEANSYTFAITEASGAVDLTSYVLNTDGELVEKQDIGSASDEAALSIGGISTMSLTSRSVSRSNSGELVVALDPGHGGYDGGAGGNGLVEKNLTLSIANYCKAELEQYYGVRVVMTRTGDEYVGLTERVERAVSQGADVFVSIHINASTASSVNGAEVIIPNQASWYYQDVHVVGSQLGDKILAQLTALGLANRGTYWKDCTNNTRFDDGSLTDYYTVISDSHSYGIPGIIVEHAFISNPSDAAFLGNENNLRALGIADAQGIIQQYGLTKVHCDVSTVQDGKTLKATASFYGGLPSNASFKVLSPSGIESWIQAYEDPSGVWTAAIEMDEGYGLYIIEAYANIGSLTQGFGREEIGYNTASLSLDITEISIVCSAGNWAVDPSNVSFEVVTPQKETLWLQGEKQPDGCWRAMSGLSSMNDPFGDFLVFVWYQLDTDTAFRLSEGSSIGNPRPQVKLSASVQSGSAKLSATGFSSQPSNASFEVVAPDGSARWYQGVRQSDGSWAAGPISLGDEFGQAGTYVAGVWATYANHTERWTTVTIDNVLGYSIMGRSSYSSNEMADLFDQMSSYPSDVYLKYGASSIDDFCKIVVEEANAEGVKAEVVFAQAMYETGWLGFGGDIDPEQCNFAGIGAVGNCASGASFNQYGKDSVRMGIRAQVQHLKAYASTEPLRQPLVDPRFDLVERGSAVTLQQLDGRWAVPGNGYGDNLLRIIHSI